MKKIFMIYVVFLSVLLSGCVTDSKVVEKSNISKKSNDFVLSFDKAVDSDSKCKTHIVVKKDNKVVLDEREMRCLNNFNIEYSPEAPNNNLLYSKFTFVKRTDENGKIYARYSMENKRMEVSNFESKDGETSIQIPKIITKNIMQNLFVEFGKKVTVKEGTLVFEITYYK